MFKTSFNFKIASDTNRNLSWDKIYGIIHWYGKIYSKLKKHSQFLDMIYFDSNISKLFAAIFRSKELLHECRKILIIIHWNRTCSQHSTITDLNFSARHNLIDMSCIKLIGPIIAPMMLPCYKHCDRKSTELLKYLILIISVYKGNNHLYVYAWSQHE